MQRTEYAKKRAAKDASKLRVGVVASRFNEDITESMLEGALETLKEWKVKDKNISLVRVAGSFEIPYGCTTLLRKKQKPHAIVALGCVIKGETKHDEYISMSVAHALQQLILKSGIPIGFGIITPNTLDQAKARSRGKANKGREAAEAALEAALL